MDRPELPADLAEFYARYEGVGLESSWDRPVRLSKLDEVSRVGWKDVDPVSDIPEGWEHFSAFRIGSGMFFEKVVYVLDAPSCPPGSILAIGSAAGPGGDGPYAIESSLVLGVTFADWLAHLERWGWWEPAIGGGRELTEPEERELRQYYRSLNPGLGVGAA
ncbi:MAG: hypothetical protein K2X87_18480 [Gemmataceae bacterium]|nr:hypothetical protein [Gemmataceae bacterium]